MKLKHYSHGECNLFETKNLPQNVKKVTIDQDYVVIAESETIGNDHRVAVKDKEKKEFFEDANGVLYMRNLVPTEVYCVHTERHDTITIPPSIWEIGKSMEYDYLEQELRSVRD